MGAKQSTVATADSNITAGNRARLFREKEKYGICQVKISVTTNGIRRTPDRISSHVVSSRGAIIYGSQCNPQIIQRGWNLNFILN